LILAKDETVIPVPKHNEIKRGLLLEIIAEAGLSKEEFLELLINRIVVLLYCKTVATNYKGRLGLLNELVQSLGVAFINAVFRVPRIWMQVTNKFPIVYSSDWKLNERGTPPPPSVSVSIRPHQGND